jgi:transposase-like protein
MHRHKKLLGMRISENEGVMLWINARNELQYSGVNNMLIAYVD